MRTSTAAWEAHLRDRRDLEPVQGALNGLLGVSSAVGLIDQTDLTGNRHGLLDVLICWTTSNDTARQLRKCGYHHQYRFALLPSRSRPRWLLPQRPGSAAVDGFEIYTPFSPGAKLMKTLLTQIRATRWQGWARHCVLIASKEPLAFERLAQEVTGETRLVFALSLGAPGVFQKLTIQVMNANGKILCYAKLPLTHAANKRLEHEARVLNTLQRFPKLRLRIPQILYEGAWNNGYVLIQTMLAGTPGPTRFSPVHSEFLKMLHECNPTMVPGRSVVRDVSLEWNRTAPQLGSRMQNLGREALRIASRELDGAQVLCGISHGDFAPWNTRIHQSNLFMFDWESAKMDAPSPWDQFHFLAQTESLLAVKHSVRGCEDIRLRHRSLCLLYLLHSTAQLHDEHAEERAIAYRERQLAQHVVESSIGSMD
jgi:hypothetical protein